MPDILCVPMIPVDMPDILCVPMIPVDMPDILCVPMIPMIPIHYSLARVYPTQLSDSGTYF